MSYSDTIPDEAVRYSQSNFSASKMFLFYIDNQLFEDYNEKDLAFIKKTFLFS
jgi:hypothetical protein